MSNYFRSYFLCVIIVVMFSIYLFSGIAGSDHDFSSVGNGLCATCHVPHKPKQNVPLWAHNMSDVTYKLYNDNATYVGSGMIYDNTSSTMFDNTSTRACLSCHDGSVAVIGNQYITANDGQWIMYDNGILGSPIAGQVNYTGLRGSHPIGVNYDPSKFGYNDISNDPDIHLENNRVQCGSCHDAHMPIVNTKFLVKDNNQSGICIACHNK